MITPQREPDDVVIVRCSSVMSASGQNLPRHLAGGAAALPLKAAAPVVRLWGRFGPQADITSRCEYRYGM